MSFDNKVVLVTGSGSGIGRATALQFAKEGANVVIVDLNEKEAKITAEKCEEFGKGVLVVKSNISKDEDAKNAIEKTIEKFGKLDVLVNNAGFSRHGTVRDGTVMDTYDEIMNNNLRSVVLMTTLAVPYLKKTKGTIVNTSSCATKQLSFGVNFPAYSISKVGVDYFTRSTALELAEFGIRVNSVNPGPVATNIVANSGISGISVQELGEATPLKRHIDPQEIADLIMYLASDKAKSITGSNNFIDCGTTLA